MRRGQYVEISDGTYAGEVGYIVGQIDENTFRVFVDSVDKIHQNINRRHLTPLKARQRRAYIRSTYHQLDAPRIERDARDRINFFMRQPRELAA